MTMLVRTLGMLVVVLVAFAEMQPDPKGHQGAGREQPQRHRLAKQGMETTAPMKGAIEK